MLPRRVPWLPGEFDLVYGYLFASNNDLNAQQLALDRAVESTADLVDILLQAAQGRLSVHAARLAYAMAITRFVNGLVDPVQQGYYARSIGSIAAQLGLPQHFVELRHAATHENLPGVVVLHQACQRALDWLYERYWLPSIQSVDAQQSLAHQHLTDELAKLFHSYKTARKAAIRDATKADPQGQEKLLLAIEKLAAGLGMQYGVADGLDAIAEQLVAPGGLVPKGKNKRSADDVVGMALPAELVAIWTPLLDHLDDAFDGFHQILLLRIMDVLCFTNDEDDEMTSLSDATHSSAATLVAWTLHLLSRSPNIDDAREVAVRLCLHHPNSATLSLLDSLSSHVANAQRLIPLARAQTSKAPAPPAPEDIDTRLDGLEARYAQVAQALRSKPTLAISKEQGMQLHGGIAKDELWQTVDLSTWRPCPIGCLSDGRVPDLDHHTIALVA